MKGFNENLKGLNITAKDFDNLVAYIYDRTPNEMKILAKIIKAAGKDVVDPIKSAFEKVLNMRYTDRIDVYRFYYEEDMQYEVF